jgi:perosamine synthetase
MKLDRINERLALFGGPKIIEEPLQRYNSIGLEEIEAAKEVVASGVLSQFLGCWDKDFYGGPKVQAFERACEKQFDVRHAVTVNSWTSGLIAAVGAIGIEPGDEVIVSPWTMCASATAILHWNAIPVFADIEPETFCLDPKSVMNCISPHTKAIMAVDIFGHSADMEALRAIAQKYNLKIISDTAQAPGAKYKGRYAGTMADIGGYSLNYHKHIHTGEGGILVTDDDLLAERLRLIRNHAEAVVEGMGVTDLSNMLGYNFRLGEIESAIGIEQLKKLNRLVSERQTVAKQLNEALAKLPGLRIPVVKDLCTHSYYMYPLILDVEALGVSRGRLCDALAAEGLNLTSGYQNLHLLPMYQKKQAYGTRGFPWSSDICHREISYAKGICPVAEDLHEKSYIGLEICAYELGSRDVENIVLAMCKVWGQLSLLR